MASAQRELFSSNLRNLAFKQKILKSQVDKIKNKNENHRFQYYRLYNKNIMMKEKKIKFYFNFIQSWQQIKFDLFTKIQSVK